jgi:tryptophan synthase alpha chain
VGALEEALRARRGAGERIFVPYVTGGVPGIDAELIRGLAAAGADAIEVGIPHSDPVMDGGVIQEASRIALARGIRPSDVLQTVRDAALEIPVVVMTYANPVVRRGVTTFLDESASAGVSGAIVPDLPVDESEEFGREAGERGIDVVLLAAPGTKPERLRAIAEGSRGFVYCVATYGVTGARDRLAGTARELVDALRPLTDRPLLVGVGIGTPEQAAEACRFADGVIVGSALMQPVLDADREGALRLAGAIRRAIDA